MVECFLSFSFTKVFRLPSLRSVLLIILYIFQWFLLCNHFSWTECSLWRSVVTAKWPGGRCSAFFQLKQDVKCCRSHLTMSQLLYAHGREGWSFKKFFRGAGVEVYIWGTYFEPFSNHLEYQVWKNVAWPHLISGLGTGRRRMEEKVSWLKKT